MQTSDNNIVRVSFSVQYRIKDAFARATGSPTRAPSCATPPQAAMREAVGRMTVDGVLRERRAALDRRSRRCSRTILDGYDIGHRRSTASQLQDVQPPAAVRAAFDDVLAATQDASRLVNEAEGYATR